MDCESLCSPFGRLAREHVLAAIGGVGFSEESRVQRNGAEGFTKGHVNGTTRRMHGFICYRCIFCWAAVRI